MGYSWIHPAASNCCTANINIVAQQRLSWKVKCDCSCEQTVCTVCTVQNVW